MPKASSKAITSSTVSSESAPRSSTKEAVGVTSASSTPNCSTMICLTRSSTLAILFALRCPPRRPTLLLVLALKRPPILFGALDEVNRPAFSSCACRHSHRARAQLYILLHRSPKKRLPPPPQRPCPFAQVESAPPIPPSPSPATGQSWERQ